MRWGRYTVMTQQEIQNPRALKIPAGEFHPGDTRVVDADGKGGFQFDRD
jgi:hypothetical protein